MPDYGQLDELGRSSQASQDTCETLIQQIRTALSEVNHPLVTICQPVGKTFRRGGVLKFVTPIDYTCIP